MKLEGFPQFVSLQEGTRVVIRPMELEDGQALLEFFRALPEEDRQYLRDDVTSQDWLDRFVRRIDYDTVIPVVADHEGTVVGNATLYRTRHGWTKHVGEIRIAVARPFQRKGLGTALGRVLLRHAIGLGLEKMIVHVVENQIAAKRALEKLGFRDEAILKGHVKDIHGIKRNLLVMSNDVSHLWEAMAEMVADYSPTTGG